MIVSFDGNNLEILLSESTGILDVEQDVYSSWKHWIQENDNAKYPQMFRTVGGDAIDTKNNIPGYFYLMNGWKVRFLEENTSIQVNGFLLVDGGLGSPYLPTAGNYNTTVHSVVALNTPGATADEIWNYVDRVLTSKVDANIVSVQDVDVSSVADFKMSIEQHTKLMEIVNYDDTELKNLAYAILGQ